MPGAAAAETVSNARVSGKMLEYSILCWDFAEMSIGHSKTILERSIMGLKFPTMSVGVSKMTISSL